MKTEQINDSELLRLNAIGLIPGPGESSDSFRERAEYCVGLKQRFREEFGHEFPFVEEEIASMDQLRETFPQTHHWMDISPDWIPLFFNNAKLAPWHGGCAWIFQMSEESPTAALLQLRKRFRETKSGFYSREEVMTHELSHVGRMLFEEPKFEELLAYRSSPSRIRRWLGPLVQSSWESMLFVVVCVLVMVIDAASLGIGGKASMRVMIGSKFLLLGMISWALFRLWRKHRLFDRALHKLRMFLSKEKANAVIYRLTDEEIQSFASMSVPEIQEYDGKDLRWRLIRTAYYQQTN